MTEYVVGMNGGEADCGEQQNSPIHQCRFESRCGTVLENVG